MFYALILKIIVKRERNAGIDLIRIIGMYAIVISHIIFHCKLIKIYKENKELNLLLTFCSWHVDSFALVSGIVGFKGNKYSNLIYLWLCIFQIIFA
jgi:hypothetical protein